MTEQEINDEILHILDPDETIRARTRAVDAEIAVTDRRLVVAAQERVALNVAIARIRRIELNIERNRSATLIIVPESPRDPPQVLAIPPDEYQAAAAALALIGQRLAEQSDRPT